MGIGVNQSVFIGDASGNEDPLPMVIEEGSLQCDNPCEKLVSGGILPLPLPSQVSAASSCGCESQLSGIDEVAP
eukprot:3281682-Prorocentrum_lima.AAC.1